MFKTLPQGLAGIWAGIVIGGSLIAAPAKFQVASLSLPLALEVGQAQFFWVGVGEAMFCASLILSALFLRPILLRFLFFPIIIFAIQRLYLMPMLDARTTEIIAGATVPPSSLHLVYVAMEIIKILLLCIFAAGGLKTTKGLINVSQT